MTGATRKLLGLGQNLGQGLSRGVAAGVLALFLVLQLAVPALFDLPRQTLFDTYQDAMPRVRGPGDPPVVVVAIDNLAINAEGEWPWRHDRLARLVGAILAERPAVLGLDLALPRAIRGAEAQTGADDALARAIAGGPVVVGVVGDGKGTCGAGPGDPGLFAAFAIVGSRRPGAGPPCFATAMRSGAAIDAAAAGHGLLSSYPDADGVTRRLRTVAMVSGRSAPGFALEVYRVAAGEPPLTLYQGRRGLWSVTAGTAHFPVDPDGGLRINFTRGADVWRCSAEGVLRRGQCLDSRTGRRITLRGRRVLLGLDAEGVGDQPRKTPMGMMPAVAIDAQGVDNLVAGQFAYRPSGAYRLEALLSAAFGLFLIIVLPFARIGWRTAAAAFAPLLVLAVGGALLWWRCHWLIDVATPAIACVVVFVGLLGGSLAEVDAQRRRLRKELEAGRLAAARAEGELEAGRRIQMGILPTPESLARDPRFDLDAVMTPARQIGGDLYDFFMIDLDRLYFAVGDVSGKGLPASLFMALGKSLCKSCALRGDTDIGANVHADIPPDMETDIDAAVNYDIDSDFCWARCGFSHHHQA